MKQPVLRQDDIDAALSAPGGPRWQWIAGKLVKVVRCNGFVGALAFVNAVGEVAERANHHPDIDIRYDRVTLALVTHDSGGITQLDIDLATTIDRIEAGVAETI